MSKYLNSKFYRPLFDDHIEVSMVTTHGRDDKGKKVKLTREIYEISYVELNKKPFTTYLEEVDRMISFKRWVLTKTT